MIRHIISYQVIAFETFTVLIGLLLYFCHNHVAQIFPCWPNSIHFSIHVWTQKTVRSMSMRLQMHTCSTINSVGQVFVHRSNKIGIFAISYGQLGGSLAWGNFYVWPKMYIKYLQTFLGFLYPFFFEYEFAKSLLLVHAKCVCFTFCYVDTGTDVIWWDKINWWKGINLYWNACNT